MMTLSLTDATEIEVLATYAAPEKVILAVTLDPGWYVVGAFRMPVTSGVRIEAYGSVSDASLLLRVRLFSLTTVLPVSGTEATTSSTVDVRMLSGLVSLAAGDYQMQAETTGGIGDGLFGSLKTMTVISP